MADSVIPELVSRGRIKAAEVLAVVDRRAFVPKTAWSKIDVDHAIYIGPVQTWLDSIMHLATLIEALDIKRGSTVLDIGCGCGHLTAIAGYLTGKTGYAVGLDLNGAVIKYAQECLSRLDVTLENVAYFPLNVYFMDKQVKFDRIVVGVACPATHVRSVISQLNVSGVLVTPMPDGKLYQIRRINDDEWTKEVIGGHKAPAMQMPQTTDEMVKGADSANSSLDAMKRWIASKKATVSAVSLPGGSSDADGATPSHHQHHPHHHQSPQSPEPLSTSGGNFFASSAGSSLQGAGGTSSSVSLTNSGSLALPGIGGGAIQYYCDKCGARIPPGGIRWRCDDCGDLDLCATCFDLGPPFPEPHDYFLHSNLVPFATGRESGAIQASTLSQVQCVHCSRYVLGLRWHCAICSKYDLCAACHAGGSSFVERESVRGAKRSAVQHSVDHPMIPFQEPGRRRLNLSSFRNLPAPIATPHGTSASAGPVVASPAQLPKAVSKSARLSPASSQKAIDQTNFRSIVDRSANELLERLKLYDVHGTSPFSSPDATLPAPVAASQLHRPQSPPVKPMFNASLYTSGPSTPKPSRSVSRRVQGGPAKGLLSGSSEDDDAKDAENSHPVRRSPEEKAVLKSDLPSAPSAVITYFGDEVAPPDAGASGGLAFSTIPHALAASSDVPIIKWGELEVGELLGSGAFGTVHAGLWRGAPVAIKRLHVAPDNPLEFMHEAAMMRKMSHHPNIIRLFGICDDPLNFAIISQLCANGSLHDLLSKKGTTSVPWHRIVGIARDAAAGAFHLHCENLIHRDLACRNILVTENWTGVISDFGLSRVLENQNKSHRTATMSAVRWAAPECLKDEKYSSKSDVWSFGMCLVEILTRGPPFPNLSYAEILRAVYTDRQLPIDLPHDSDPVFKDLVAACCKQSPDDRADFKLIYSLLDSHFKALMASMPK